MEQTAVAVEGQTVVEDCFCSIFAEVVEDFDQQPAEAVYFQIVLVGIVVAAVVE